MLPVTVSRANLRQLWDMRYALLVYAAAANGGGLLAAQTPALPIKASLSLTAGPAVIVETFPRIQDLWYEGASIGLRLSVPLVHAAAVTIQGVAFRAADGRTLQTATGGVEFRLGRRRRIPIALGLGIVRQPAEPVCVDTCPPDFPRFGHRSRPTVGFSLAYEWPITSRLRLGPDFTLTRTPDE